MNLKTVNVKNDRVVLWIVENFFYKLSFRLLVSGAIFMIGFLLTFFGIYEDAFPMSGCLLVSIGILGAYSQYFISEQRKHSQLFLNSNIHNVAREAMIKNGSYNEDEINEMHNKNTDWYNQISGRIQELDKISTNMPKLEFSYGFVGTLIWGFGHLLYGVGCEFIKLF